MEQLTWQVRFHLEESSCLRAEAKWSFLGIGVSGLGKGPRQHLPGNGQWVAGQSVAARGGQWLSSLQKWMMK